MRAKPGEYVLETTAPGFRLDKLPVRLSAATQSTERIALVVENIRNDQVDYREPPIETLGASLTATLPLTPVPPPNFTLSQ